VLKKLLLALVLLVAVVLVAMYWAGGTLLAFATNAVLPDVLAACRNAGWEVTPCTFVDADVKPLARLYWRGLHAGVSLPKAAEHFPEKLTVDAAEVSVDLCDGVLRAEGLALPTSFMPRVPAGLPFSADEFGIAVDRVDEGFLEVRGLSIERDARETIKSLLGDLGKLAQDGRITRDVRAGARLHFTILGRNHIVRLETERRNGATWLRFNSADIAELSRTNIRPLTPAEQELLCRNPHRALIILRIKEYAERLAMRLSRADTAYGEDFTRHVVWSYWLTRTLGADFAQKVTDAHEIGATDNTEADHRQDYANNAVGRSYALARKTESQVLQLIRTDPQIVRVAK
jgi:hypothetical protein